MCYRHCYGPKAAYLLTKLPRFFNSSLLLRACRSDHLKSVSCRWKISAGKAYGQPPEQKHRMHKVCHMHQSSHCIFIQGSIPLRKSSTGQPQACIKMQNAQLLSTTSEHKLQPPAWRVEVSALLDGSKPQPKTLTCASGLLASR